MSEDRNAGAWAEYLRQGGDLPPALARQIDEAVIAMARETAQSYRDLALHLSALWDRHGDGEFIAASGKLNKIANDLETRAYQEEERLADG